MILTMSTEIIDYRIPTKEEEIIIESYSTLFGITNLKATIEKNLHFNLPEETWLIDNHKKIAIKIKKESEYIITIDAVLVNSLLK